MQRVVLELGGKLSLYKWNSDQLKEQVIDVTDFSNKYLWHDFEVDTGATVGDLFLLMHKKMQVYDLIIGAWCCDYINHVLEGNYENDSIECAELYWNFSISQDWKGQSKSIFHGHSYPSFHLIGKDGIEYSALGVDTASLKNIPLRLKTDVDVFNEMEFCKNRDYANREKYIQHYDKTHYTLIQVMVGIIKEVSFFGGPKQSVEKFAEIFKIEPNIKDGG